MKQALSPNSDKPNFFNEGHGVKSQELMSETGESNNNKNLENEQQGRGNQALFKPPTRGTGRPQPNRNMRPGGPGPNLPNPMQMNPGGQQGMPPNGNNGMIGERVPSKASLPENNENLNEKNDAMNGMPGPNEVVEKEVEKEVPEKVVTMNRPPARFQPPGMRGRGGGPPRGGRPGPPQAPRVVPRVGNNAPGN